MGFTMKSFIQKIKYSDKQIKPLQVAETISPIYLLRKEIAARYLRSEGIEIGALHAPVEVPSGVTVRYLDRMSTAQLKQTYRELSEYELVNVDIVDDGEVLTTVLDNSVNFVIANHMIEHCQNPILTLQIG
jgi:hypothetical protein